MLNEARLYAEIKKAFDETIPDAVEHTFRSTFLVESTIGDKTARDFGVNLNKAIAEPLAKRLASAIDFYVRNAELFGDLITKGTSFSQHVRVDSTHVPTINGNIINTLGIR